MKSQTARPNVSFFPYRFDQLSDFQKKFYYFLKDISYKPGSMFTINPTNIPTVVKLSVRVLVDNLEGTDNKTELHSRPIFFDEYVLNDFQDKEVQAYILRRVFNLLLEVETHEAQEWFRMFDIPVIDPHPEIPKV